MKKTFLTAFAALLVAIPAVQAQKVNKSGLLTKIEKSDADIADAIKGSHRHSPDIASAISGTLCRSMPKSTVIP